MQAIIRYFRDWLTAVGQFLSYRNTIIATLTVSLLTLINRHHTLASYLPPKYRASYAIPLYFLSYGAFLFVIPLLTAPLLAPSERFGIRLGKVRTWLTDVIIAWAILLALILIFGRQPQFVRYYPIYQPVGGAWTWQILLFWELCQLVYMLGWEFTFRGYLLFAAKREIGLVPAIILQMLPFAFLHIGKPELEAYGAIFAGLFLGLIAARGNSFLPCALLHFAVALTMDLFALIYKGILRPW